MKLTSLLGLALRVSGAYKLIPDGGGKRLTLASGAQILILGCVEPGLQSTWDRYIVRRDAGRHLQQTAGFCPKPRWLHDGGPCLAGIVPRMATDEVFCRRIIEEEIAPLIDAHGTEHIIVLEHDHCAGRKMLMGRVLAEREEEEHINNACTIVSNALQRQFPDAVVHPMVARLNGRHDAFRGVECVTSLSEFLDRREFDRNQHRARAAEQLLSCNVASELAERWRVRMVFSNERTAK